MLNVIMFYKNDAIGRKLVNLLSENLKTVECKDILIKDIPYIQITMKDEAQVTRTINSPQKIDACMDVPRTGQMLELSGINFGSRVGETIIRYYDVLIFDMNVISIKVRAPEANTVKYIKEAECTKAVEAARKSIYILGLDYGMVTIGLTGKRKLRVMRIYDSPKIRKKDMDTLVNKIKSLINQNYPRTESDKEIKIGADPEFMLFNAKSGKMIAASDLFPREGIVGCDNIRTPNRQQRPVAEIRPNPACSPRELANNIKKALTSAREFAPYNNVRWVAGSQPVSGFSIGGHIHFSNIPLNYALLRTLDNYLGLVVFLIENPISAARRRKKYGHLADIRLKNYGGFEYRTPGSWLVTPEIACAVLCLAKIVVEHYLELKNAHLDNPDALQAFYQGDQDYFRPIFQKIWSDVTKTSTYSEYKEELKIIPYMIENSITWDEKADIKVAWKIETATKRKYLSKTKNPVVGRSSSRRTNTNIGRNNRSLGSHNRSGLSQNVRVQP
jgi:hypothetical protein